MGKFTISHLKMEISNRSAVLKLLFSSFLRSENGSPKLSNILRSSSMEALNVDLISSRLLLWALQLLESQDRSCIRWCMVKRVLSTFHRVSNLDGVSVAVTNILFSSQG